MEALLDLVGGKWKLLILYHLYGERRRFGDLRRLVGAVSEKMLSQQLKELAADDLVRRIDFKTVPHQVDLASPKGGEVMFDTHSDPRTPDGAYADDLISLGFVHHAKFGAMLKNTLPISAISVDDYDAVWVAGGGGPLLTFRDDTALHALIAAFYEKGKIVALICHGSSLLLWTRLSNGRLLAEGKKWTGFTDEEEEEVNTAFGMTLNDYTIESEAASIAGTSFLCRGANEPFAIRDGRLITGQQQYSSGITADLVLEALDEE
ncbi:winged helix-turn-helix transcriptional regulator [Brevundimonas diminuta]|uniref:winged helix-turn-helix transcriptional regulator n=1 Tax=Brevundimonas TaxID=41275 RepID=UPI00241C488A|nr:winged helix-turn-helix transcriptional regulator [Brevundimonas diminuta]